MSAKPVNVAVVDDDDRVRRAFTRLLRAAGFNPIGYSSAEEFLDDAAGRQTDCVVLDIQLSGMSGFDLQKQLKAEGDDPPIIFITAHDEPDTLDQTQQTGCFGFFRKPVTGGVLLAAIRQAVGMGENSTD